MKIKIVCDVTGLTDRTIRYYIEERLITPAYTENYLGRKSFDFSQKDIDTLKSISILRKFDFSIDEIRQIIEDENSSNTVILNVKRRTEESVAVGTEKLQILSALRCDKIYTLGELAEALSTPAAVLPEYKEAVQLNPVKSICSFLKSAFIFTIVWLPFVFSLLVVIMDINYYHYPVFDAAAIFLTILSFWPAIAMLIVPKTNWKWKKAARKVLLVLCVLSIPVSSIMSFGIVSRSETTVIYDYRSLDADCIANRYLFYQKLFPTWPQYSDSQYYYCMRPAIDYTYDIFAQWPLEDADFRKEVRRVKALFEERNYVTVQKGNYTCLISYSGDPPFQEVTDSYTYYIFAYDETNLVVRYILCDSLENGADQPYYLSLDW